MEPVTEPLRVSRLLNLAGALTLVRVPLTIAASLLKHEPWALEIILVAFVITDVLDGPVARRTGTASRVGAVADAFADKIFLINFAWAMELAGHIPGMILVPWFIREIIQGASIPMLALRYAMGRGRYPKPTPLGRLTTISVTLAMAGALLDLRWLLTAGTVAAGVLGTVGSLDYMRRERPWERFFGRL